MTCFVAHDVADELPQQRLGARLVDRAERGQRQALDQDLHAEVGDVPAGVGEDVVDERAEVRVHRVAGLELLVEVAAEHLDVAGLVDHLRRRVVLGVDPRARSRRCGRCRSARPARRAGTGSRGARRSPSCSATISASPQLRTGEPGSSTSAAHVLHAPVVARELDRGAFGIDVDRPVEIGRAVPLRGLRLLVELVERGPLALGVVPGEASRRTPSRSRA